MTVADRIADIWGARTPYPRDGLWPVREDQVLADGVTEDDVDRWVQSACVLCSNGCACDIAVKDGADGRGPRPCRRSGQPRATRAEGSLRQLAGHVQPGPAHAALIRENGRLVECDWDTAMARIVERSRSCCRAGAAQPRLLHQRPALPRGVLRPGGLGKAGIGTPHMDGNTRLCTATAAAALKESFGADGQPGTYADIDHCDAIFLYGHNMAETQTVLWARVLDRWRARTGPKSCASTRAIPSRPRCRRAPRRPARHQSGADERPGPRSPRERLGGRGYVAAHRRLRRAPKATSGRGRPRRPRRSAASAPRTSARRPGSSAPRARALHRAAGLLPVRPGDGGVCQVNNLHLLRGMLGRPGCGILQMNGQPTAQNNRECGADGDLRASATGKTRLM